ncbi:DUF58 domain-containing protein [Sediminitomix flava]|uniref:Uncharacterized protein DUF58 n=1 Tax=Sediminitomix flava TaxID=379075 RepID=A0A315ZGG9_SEDFL|nr:DUF58 domain-containing protein [Sediminitomix flava]PWJ44253.1 uncharacterized protein DUF58 [Sediminitomix flava]
MAENHRKYPEEIAITLDDLIKWEYYAAQTGLLPKRPVHSILSGGHASRLRGRGLDFEEVRNYVAGDDIRNIDWKVTARTKVTHTKVFNEEKERPSLVILDQTTQMFFGSERFMKSVIAIQIAALSAFRTLHSGDRVGSFTFTDDEILYFSPKRNRSYMRSVMETLVEKNQELVEKREVKPNLSQLNETLRQATNVAKHDYVMTIISDFNYANEETINHLLHLSKSNDVILVHIADKMDKALPDGNILLTNGHEQIMWNNEKKGAQSKYQKEHEHFSNTIIEEFRKYGIPTVQLNTAEDIADQIRNVFQ